MWAQFIGGTAFSLFSGEPLTQSNNINFLALYAWTGIFNGIFLVIFSLTNLSKLMKYSTRFVEETFAMFITCAFTLDSCKPLVQYFNKYYCDGCDNSKPLLYLILNVSTLLIGITLFNFKKSVLLNGRIREIISDYALPISCLLTSFLG